MALSFEDFKPYIQEKDLKQICEVADLADAQTLFDVVYTTAKTVVKDHLFSRYDTTVIFASDLANYPQVKRWVIVLCIYYLYERIPDKLVPERVVKNYDDVMEMIDKVADAKLSIDLPKLLNEDTTPKTKFRWGSEPKKSQHNN